MSTRSAPPAPALSSVGTIRYNPPMFPRKADGGIAELFAMIPNKKDEVDAERPTRPTGVAIIRRLRPSAVDSPASPG